MRIAVYCSAKDDISGEYKAQGKALGLWLAQQGHTLIYGGATGGLMTKVSEAYRTAPREAGQQLIGVIPHCIIASGRQASGCDKMIIVTDMAERKRTMREMADCFIVLPGSYGTLDELFDVIASGTVGEHHKPLYILNYQGFYDHLMLLVQHMQSLHFLPKNEIYKPIFVESLDQLQQQILNTLIQY